MHQVIVKALCLVSISFLLSCSKSSTDAGTLAAEDTSASGAAAGVVGQALGGSSSNGSVAFHLFFPQAFAAGACPTVRTANGAGCTQNANAADIIYSACSFGGAAATWSGTMEITLSSGTAVNCGTFPNTAALASGQSIQRQFVTSGAPGTATRTSAFGTVITVDDASANLANFDTGTSVAANIGSGYGTQVAFDGSGRRNLVTVAHRIYSSKFDHSISGGLTVSESGTTRTVSSGTIKVFHNRLKVVGTASFSNVVFNDTCATPVSGTISTTFAAGANISPTVLGAAVVGKTETLTFSSCGSQTLVDTSGNSSAVAISGI